MKPLAVYRRVGMGLAPTNPAAVADLLKVKEGDRSVFERRQPRNLEHHRKMFGIFQRIIQATGKWHSPDALLDDLMQALKRGEYRTNVLTGDTVFVRERINFEAMSQAAFAELYDQIRDLLLERLGFDPELLLDEAA